MTKEEKIELIANKLFGWDTFWWDDEGRKCWRYDPSGYSYFDPYTSWGDCGLVIERLTERGQDWILTWAKDCDPPYMFEILVLEQEAFKEEKSDNGKSAVCDAVVAMFVEEVEKETTAV